MKILSIVGARPQFVKLKPVSDALSAVDCEHIILHTGQHYDPNMSDLFFEGLGIPAPDLNLGIGSGSHGKQTAEMILGLESALVSSRPDWVIVYGDTNSTLAGAIAASKLNLRLAHIEAGLRSRNRSMPEELNRIATDHLSSVLFAPTNIARQNLEIEGLGERSELVGDVMADLLFSLEPMITPPPFALVDALNSGEPYIVATIHRASNTDSVDRLNQIMSNLVNLERPVFLVVHPRLRAALAANNVQLARSRLTLLDPVGYLDMLGLVRHSFAVITDSGGLQKDAFLLGVPCITLRSETEWPETFEGEMNVLSPLGENLVSLLTREVRRPDSKPFGDGMAAIKIVQSLISQI